MAARNLLNHQVSGTHGINTSVCRTLLMDSLLLFFFFLLIDQHSATPKTAVIAGVRFHRTKTGNLVANRIVQDQRYVASAIMSEVLTLDSRSGVQKKAPQPCKLFSTTGNRYFQMDRTSARSKRDSSETRGWVWVYTNETFCRFLPQRPVLSIST